MLFGTHILRTLYLHPLCRKIFILWLCFLAVVLLATPNVTAQSCSITPSFQAVKAGDCVQFTASGCSDWTLNGSGTLDQSGRYCAPPTVFVQNYSKGSQILPNNFGANAYIGRLPVHPNTWWLTRIATAGAQGNQHMIKLGGGPRYYKGLYTNMCDENTPKQLMHSVYPWGPYQDVLFPEVLPPDVSQQNGYNMYVYGAKNNGTGPDRHRFCVNKDSGIDYEEYNPYFDSHNPVVRPGHVTTLEFDTNVIRELRSGMAIQLNHVSGACQPMNWTGAGTSSFPLTITSQQPATNGYARHVVGTIAYDSSGCSAGDFTGAYFATGGSNCQFCNVGTMMAWPNYDNSIYGGTDAAGTSLVATSIDPNQWYHNVVDNVVDPTTGRVEAVSHLLRTTFVNAILSPRNQGIAVTGNNVTYNHPLMSVSCVAGNPTVCSTSTNLATNGFNACEDTPWVAVQVGTCPHFHVHFQGITGGQWTTLNNTTNLSNEYYATLVTDTYHFTIPVNSTGWGTANWANARIAFGWLPYGQVMRLKSSFNVESYCTGDVTTSCPFIKALLRTLPDYGVAAFDGTNGFNDDWNTGILTNEFEPAQIVAAAKDITSWTFIEPYMELVDTSTLMSNMGPNKLSLLNNQQGATSFRRTQVCVNHGTVCADANLVGTAIGFPHERLPLIPAGKSWKEPVIVTGNVNTAYSCSFESPVAGANITSDGTITAPSTVTTEIAYKEKCVAAADPNVAAYASGYFVPSSPDGHLRLHLGGENLSYTDTHGKVWWEQTSRLKNAGQGQVFESPLGCDYCPLYGSQIVNPSPGWSGYPDGAGFYGMSVSARDDVAMRYAVGSGDTTVTLYGESGLGVSQAGLNVFDVEINGRVVDSIDGFIAAGGQYRGYTRTYNVTVPSDGLLWVVLRDRIDTTTDPYGMSISAIEIAPSNSNPLRFTPPAQLPGGLVSNAYQYQFTASGGVAPYSFTLTQGSLPSGLALSALGLLSGTPTQAGTFSFTVQACDSTTGQPQCLSAASSLTITAPTLPLQITTASLPGAIKGTPYDVFLQGQGGVQPYKWSSLSILPQGVQLTSAGELKGTPLQSGTFTLNIRLADSGGSVPATAKLSLTISGTAPPVITTGSLPAGTVGRAYPLTQIQVSGGQSPYTWVVTSGSLPPGLQLSRSGAVSGTPKATGSLKPKTYTFAVQVSDAANQRATANLSITIQPVTLTGPAGVASKAK